MEPPPSAPTIFHGFRKLAPELRLQVWKDALPEPRIIDLRLLNDNDEPTSSNLKKVKNEHWHREARDVYLKSYKKTDILEGLGCFRRQLYAYFSRELLYQNCLAYELRSGSPWQSEIPNNLGNVNAEWTSNTEQLAARVDGLHP